MEKSSETQGDESIRKHLRQELLNELPRLGLGSAALLISSISNQAFPRAMGRLIDNDYSWKIGMIVLGGGLASLVRTYSLQTAEARIGQRLSDAAVSHLLRYKDLEWFRQSEQESDPVVLASSILHDDVPKIAKTLTVTVANMVRSTSAVVLSSVNMLLVSPSLLGVAASVVPLVGAAGMFLRKTIRKMSEADSTLSDTTSSFLQERLRHIAMVRQYDRSNDEFAAYLKFQQQRLDLLEKNSLREGLFMGFLFSATASALMLVVWMGGKAVARGRMTGGQLTSFSTYAFLLGIGTSGLVKAYSEGAAGLVAAERYYSLLADQDDEGRTSKEMLQKEDTRKQMDKPQNVQTMEIRDLHFSYKGSSRSCLNGLSFELRRGEVVALVGANGTGKTTVASLLCGLLAPTNGSILVDDPSSKAKVDLSDLNSTSKQRIVQMIPQSAALFDISIVENVQYGNPKASLLDIRYALSKAKCNDFISRLPEGLDSKVGIDGVKLSGGQRQRLALARALLADPPILIMDEPATALDAEGFGVIAETVSSGRGRAMLLITHSAKTLEMAHRILVLDEGKIVEKGTFRELRENKKSKLCELMPSLAGMQ